MAEEQRAREEQNKQRLRQEHEAHWRQVQEEQAAKERQNQQRVQQEHEQYWRRVQEEQRAQEQQRLQGLAQSHELHWYRQKVETEQQQQPPPTIEELRQPFEEAGGARLVYAIEPMPPPPPTMGYATGAMETPEREVVEIAPAPGQPSLLKVTVQQRQLPKPGQH